MKELCRLDDLSDPGSGAFVADMNGAFQAILLIRQGHQVFGYLNNCPHIGAPLNGPDRNFLDRTAEFILCSNHGALFRIEDGFCLSGPCAGKSLTSVAIELRDGVVILK
ncbi:MAG TPA: Rieske 2Fe-2S domain-containing protein [Rhodospirillaceae bacterium]|nr:Rieske 2Fe-2S domain-containing protein [Rhodospirillaceae bacterium]